MKEIWKPIKDYEEYYEISNYGRVKSLRRHVDSYHLNGRTVKEKIIKPILVRGYSRVVLSKDNKRKRFLVHRLVGLHFIPNLESKPYINHINSIKTDNNVDNLEWCSQSENLLHAIEHNGLKTVKERKQVYMCNKDGKELLLFESMKEAYRITKIHHTSISKVCLGNRLTAGGYKWRFENEM